MNSIGRALTRSGIFFVSILTIAALLGTSRAAPASAAGSSLSFTPDADGYVKDHHPTTSYGTLTTLRVDGSPDVRSFVRFTVSGVGSQQVSQVLLQVYPKSSSSTGIAAASVADNTWSERTLTYSTMPAMGATLASTGAVVTGTWVSLDVTAFVHGDGVYSFGLTTPGATAISLAARESGANAPRLDVTLGGGGVASSTPTAAAATNTPVPVSATATPVQATVTPAPATATAAPATATAVPPSPTAVPPTATATTAPAPAGAIQHVFVLVMENKSYSQVWNTSSSPYITNLGNSYVRATNYYALSHPSLPNYLQMYAGSNYGITTDCSPSASCHSSARSLADNLEAKGLTWKTYQESMPSPCALAGSGNYAPRHNPFVYFDDIRTNASRCNSHVIAYSALSGDLASASTTPNFVFITPDLCNDMHNCSIRTGDNWLAANVPPILNSPACTTDKCLLILTWDEDYSSGSNQVLTIFAGPAARTGGATSNVAYNHYSLLRTVENIFGLPTQTGNDGAASPMTDMLR